MQGETAVPQGEMIGIAQNSGRTMGAAAEAIERVRALINSGKLVPGQRLVEVDLMRELGLGRGPVREALRILSGDGIVELVPNRGARLRTFTAKEIANIQQVTGALQFLSLDLILARDPESLDFSELKACCERIRRASRGGSKLDLMRELWAHQRAMNALTDNPFVGIAMERMNVDYYSTVIAGAVPYATLVSCGALIEEITEVLECGDGKKVLTIARRNYNYILDALSAG